LSSKAIDSVEYLTNRATTNAERVGLSVFIINLNATLTLSMSAIVKARLFDRLSS
jgi:hypothetical protein